MRIVYPERDRDSLIAELRTRVEELAEVLPLARVTLFGSWAAGRATASSDIDLLVIHEDPPRPEAYKLVRSVVVLRGLEPHVYAQSEAQGVSDVLGRMTRDAVELYPLTPQRHAGP